MGEAETQKTIKHEKDENALINEGKSYWKAHTQLIDREHKSLEAKSMSNMIRKSVPLMVRKGTDGQDEIVISTPNYDRGNDRVFPSGAKLDNYLKNPVIMWIHDYKGQTPSAGLPVAKNSYLKVTDEGIIAGPPKFLPDDPFADRVKNAWDKGYLTTASIGFAPITFEQNEKGGTDYTEWEMLEWSFAPIPMNAEAARIAKAEGLDELVEKEIVTKPEETENTIRIPIESSDKHKGHRMATIDISEKDGISALYCGECKVVITYLFAKDKGWTMDKAEAWVKEHKKSFSPKQFSQDEIQDEIDYLCKMIDESGLSRETEMAFKKLADYNKAQFLRLSGSDIPVDINKSLTQKTAQAIKDAMDACDKVSSLLDGHHKAHGEAYKGCRDIIKSCKDGLNLLLLPLQMPVQPEEDEDKTLESLKLAFDKSVKSKLEV